MTNFFATCARGIEPLLAGELAALGARDVTEARAGCSFAGELADAYRACLWSRTGSRVLLPIATFDAADAEALYAGVRTIRWQDHLGPKETLAVHFTAGGEANIGHTHFGALKVKDAIVDQLRDELGARPSVDTNRPDVRVQVYQSGAATTVSIDLSGESLHRRGWRAPGAPAPLKETLAAALLLIADWPARAQAGAPLVDPMCGSGTIPIEGALMALDRAPGLGRAREHTGGFGFVRWRGHDTTTWRRIVGEAEARAAAGASRPLLARGFDVDPRAVQVAERNAGRVGMAARVSFQAGALADCAAEADEPPGILVCNPPYGERLGEVGEWIPLYRSLGDVLKRRFPGFTGYVLTGEPELAKEIGLRPKRRHVLYNGAIECRLLEIPVSTEAPLAEPAWRRPRAPDPASSAFQNRVLKNLRHLRKWARREEVTCFRIYDADLPEYAVAVDLYEDALHVQEYAPPKTVDAQMAARRLEDVVALLPETCGVAPENLFLKARRRQRPESQYERLDTSGALREVREGGHRFYVNLRDYLDTGLFLDHRNLRRLIGERARGARFLNLFGYTGTASVYAAKGGALSTVTVDLSNTYLDWARKNFELNHLRGPHTLERADVLEWLRRDRGSYDLALVAPPTFSNSKAMQGTFDVQRDHVELLRAVAARLSPDGVILFSNHFRRFKMDETALPELHVESFTTKTLPPDFVRAPRTHNSWRLWKRAAVL